MKANSPSLIVYFAVCLFTIGSNLLGEYVLVSYAKAVLIPSIFIYYLITNNYKIDIIKGGIFIFCFIGDILNFLKLDESTILALISFLCAYLFLLKLVIDDFRKLRLNEKDIVSTLVVMFLISLICITVLSLKFEKMKLDFSIYIMYGVVLSFLSFFSIVNYMKRGSYAFFNLILMAICFIISDIFFILNNFYIKLSVFSLTGIIPQVLCYFFMVNYFIENDKDKE